MHAGFLIINVTHNIFFSAPHQYNINSICIAFVAFYNNLLPFVCWFATPFINNLFLLLLYSIF